MEATHDNTGPGPGQWSEVSRARATRKTLLSAIEVEADTIERLERELSDARTRLARRLQDAKASSLTQPQERQRAARVSRQWRNRLEALPLPSLPPGEDPAQGGIHTDPLFTGTHGTHATQEDPRR